MVIDILLIISISAFLIVFFFLTFKELHNKRKAEKEHKQVEKDKALSTLSPSEDSDEEKSIKGVRKL